MLKISWHIGDVVRKLRKAHHLRQGDGPKRANTISSLERGRNFESETVTTAAEWLSAELIRKGIIDAPLTVEDLMALVPVPRNEAAQAQLDPAAREVALMFQRLSVRGKAIARSLLDAAEWADQHGGFGNAGGPTGTTER